MELGTYTFRMNLPVGKTLFRINIPMDVVIQPKEPWQDHLPILIEAKSAGDFTNTNKRRKEEAAKIHQLQVTYGPSVQFILFLCGYFGSDYLGYEAAEGIDWVWEHRIDDLLRLGFSPHDCPVQQPGRGSRQTIQAALDARRSARDRNRLGQFATPNSLAVEIACYVQSIAGRFLHSIRFSDPSIGTGSFYSAALSRLRSRTDRARDRCGVRSRQ